MSEEKLPYGRFVVGMTSFILISSALMFGQGTFKAVLGPVPASIAMMVLWGVFFLGGLWGFPWMIGGRAHANAFIRFAIRSTRDTPFVLLWIVRRIYFGKRYGSDENDWVNQRLARSMQEECDDNRKYGE